MKRTFFRETTISISVMVLIGLIILLIFIEHGLDNDLLEFASFRQQENAASTLLSADALKTLGFWRWGLIDENSSSSNIYTSYPSIGYGLKAILITVGADSIIYSVALGVATILIISICLHLSITFGSIDSSNERHLGKQKLLELGIAPSALLMTNPSLLGMIPEPDWQESFLLLSSIALAMHSIKKYKSATTALIFAFTIYFPAALAALLCKTILALSKTKARQTRRISANFYRRLKYKRRKSKPASSFHAVNIFYCAFLGLIIYFGWRRAAEYLCSVHLLEISGSSLLTRVGIGHPDTSYGGALSLFRIFTPLPNRLLSLQISGLNIERAYSYANQFTLAVSHALIACSSLLAALYAATKPHTLLKSYKGINGLIGTLRFFAICTIPLIFILPQTMSVHFRLTDRLISPLTAIGTCLIARIISDKITTSRLQGQLIYSLATILMCIDQIRYFLTFYFPAESLINR